MTTEEARQRVWNGKVYICIEVREPLSYGSQKYMLAANRISYLQFYLDEILAYFNEFLDHSKEGNWWFKSVENTNETTKNLEETALSPVKPIGLLYDMLCEKIDPRSPWHIELKKGNYPSENAIELNSNDEIKDIWNNHVKESCYINRGSSKEIMRLTRETHERLWSSIIHCKDPNNCAVFWNIVGNIFNPIATVPVKIHYCEESKWSQKQYAVQLDQTISDLPIYKTHSRIISHGIELIPELKMASLYKTLAYPDGFLHFVTSNPEVN